MEYGSVEWFEEAGRSKVFFGNSWNTRWKASTKIRYKHYVEYSKSYLSKKGVRVLDLGCCTGDFLNVLHKKFRLNEYYGVDIANSAIEKLKKEKYIKNAVCSTIEEVGKVFSESQFDIVYATGVIQFVDPSRYEDTFGGISRILKHGGLFLLEYPMGMDRNTERKMLSVIRRYFNISGKKSEFWKWYINAFKSMWYESFNIRHNNIVRMMIMYFIMSNYLLAKSIEGITRRCSDGTTGVSGTVLLLNKRIL